MLVSQGLKLVSYSYNSTAKNERFMHCVIHLSILWLAGKGRPVCRSDGKVMGTLVKLGANCSYVVTAWLKKILQHAKMRYCSIYCHHRDSDIKPSYCPFKLLMSDAISPRGCCVADTCYLQFTSRYRDYVVDHQMTIISFFSFRRIFPSLVPFSSSSRSIPVEVLQYFFNSIVCACILLCSLHRYRYITLFWNPILFAICTYTFSKWCEGCVLWPGEG
jgi:hypothetical protein